MSKDRVTKEVTFDFQSKDLTNNISTINSIDKLKTCVLKAIDDIAKNIKDDIIGLSWFSVKFDVSNQYLSVDTDITYLRLENDLEYNSRLEFADKVDQNTITSLRIQAKKLGYKLEKIDE